MAREVDERGGRSAFEEAYVRELEAAGRETVRLKVQAGLYDARVIALVLEWLAETDATAATRQRRCAKWSQIRETFTAVMAALAAITAIAELVLTRYSP